MRQEAKMQRKEKNRDILELKDLNKTVEQSDNATWRDKAKYIGKRRET